MGGVVDLGTAPGDFGDFMVSLCGLPDPAQQHSVRPPSGSTLAVFGIIAFLDVPLVFISARFTKGSHPDNAGFDTGGQYAAFGLSILAVLVLSAILIWLRYDIMKCRNQLEHRLSS